MTRLFRRIAPMVGVLFCFSFSGCHGDPGGVGAVKTASDAGSAATTAAPALDIGEAVNRMISMDGAKDFTAEMRMISVNEKGKRDQVDFKVQRKYSADKVSTFLTIISPREETDKAFLAVEKPDQATEAYSYLSGLKRLARMNSNRQLGFRGAKVTVQELLGMELNQYARGAGESAKVGENDVTKVEFKEKPERSLAYPRIVGYFKANNGEPARFELFDVRGELQKIVDIAEIKTFQNRQTITLVQIEDIQQKLKLKLETRKVEYDRGLPDGIFTEDHLKNFISGASRRLDQ